MKLTDEQIEKMVNWWGDAISQPKFDNGDDSYVGGMASVLANMLASNNVPTAEQVTTFKDTLRKYLVEIDFMYDYTLRVDYNPCEVLAKAGDAADIADTRFPWKTTMRVDDKGKVSVYYGYGAKEQVL